MQKHPYDTKYKKSTVINAIVLTSLLFFGAFTLGQTYFSNDNTNETIALKKVTVPSDSSSNHLYKISTETKSFLVASDQIILETSGTPYSIEEIHTNDFWDPVSCSRVPFIKQGSKIYFLELTQVASEDGLQTIQIIYVLDIDTHTLVRYDLPDIQTTGYLYKYDTTIYIATPSYQNNELEGITLYVLNENIGALQKIKTLETDSYKITDPVFRRSNLGIALSYYDKNLDLQSFVYNGGNSFTETKLTKEKIEPEMRISFEKGVYKIYDALYEDFIVKASLSRFDHVQILDKSSQKVLVELQNDDINKYVLTEYDR